MHLEEGKRGIRRREHHVGLPRCQGCRNANTGDQTEHTQDPRRVDGARVADYSAGGGWEGGGRERAAATQQGKGVPGGSVAEVRTWAQIFNPPPLQVWRCSRESWEMKVERKINTI